MNGGWETVKLKDVCAIDKTKHSGRSLPYVGLEHIESGTGRFLGEYSPVDVKSSTFQFGPEHVLYGRLRPYLNKVLLPDFEGHCSSEIFPLKPKKPLDKRFLFYWITWQPVVDEIDKTSTGARMPRANVNQLLEFDLLLPSLDEQKRIVAILDEAFAGIETAIANTEKNLANARELFESYLNSVFRNRGETWKEVLVEEVCDSIIDCINKTAPQVEGPTPFKMVRTTNVRDGRINLDSVKYVTEEIYHKWTRRQIPQRGDVILTREAPMGEVGMLDTEEKVFLGQRLVSYRANPRLLNNRFLLYGFQSNCMQSQIHALASGSTVQHMRVPDSKKLKISLPALHVQREIVQRLDSLLDEVKRIESIYRQKLTALAELKQSLLRKAFSGELTADKAEDEVQVAVA
ncbi:hypothetical protein TspCOW1_06030 [Thiohalobacter sp. COW1]|uniref:restriction endonuclease subunit S n=1 Tax=Thiohalobacter sp. COW1 TaxID=2795687 RepID=UPI001915FE58|nr:restriction endonuclease subunit S [Thiohalobacter sp. COW1]BCO30500.1 hypothetical protein TspCOW1_06030 [Thiohalobacter sp. COW1]